MLDRIEVFRDWEMGVDDKMVSLKGSKFGVPQIDNNGQIKSYEDYQKMRVKHLQPLILNDGHWAMVYSKRNFNMADEIVKMIGKASTGLGMAFKGEPSYIEIPDDQTLLNDGYTRDQLKNGGNYAECITADL